MPRQKRKKYPKLTTREKELAKKYVPEEVRTKKYERKTAVAIGLSRARREAAHEELDAVVRKYL